jgi:hypothetical protein
LLLVTNVSLFAMVAVAPEKTAIFGLRDRCGFMVPPLCW